jgi:hypothetical protein
MYLTARAVWWFLPGTFSIGLQLQYTIKYFMRRTTNKLSKFRKRCFLSPICIHWISEDCGGEDLCSLSVFVASTLLQYFNIDRFWLLKGKFNRQNKAENVILDTFLGNYVWDILYMFFFCQINDEINNRKTWTFWFLLFTPPPPQKIDLQFLINQFKKIFIPTVVID